MRNLRLGMAQINTTVGDFKGNTKKILESIDLARDQGTDLLTFPELAICGYPPEDLLLKPQFIKENLISLDRIIDHSHDISIVVGFVDSDDDIYNAAAMISDGKLVNVYHKMRLPNYGVFDENRYFHIGAEAPVYILSGIGIGINICEDIWYESGPTTAQAYAGAEVIINISASPYYIGRSDARQRMLSTRASDNIVIVAYNNLVGGQDELVFDGNSLVLDEKGYLLAKGKHFEEDFIAIDLDIENVFRSRLRDQRWRKEMPLAEKQGWSESKTVVSETSSQAPKPPLPKRKIPSKDPISEVYDALVLGTRDYIHKNGFKKVLVGLSGGIDSALVAAIAVDAISPSNVAGVTMPSMHSSTGSITDSEALAHNLGIDITTIAITKLFQTFIETLEKPFAGTKPNVAEENLQARIRGNLLMAISNKFGWLLLTTGNKSEMATGYATLYGDMAGGFAPLKDVPKTLVYELSLQRNTQAGYDLIPSAIITKEPSAELRPNQLDTDSLPPYELLDPILTAYVEEDKSVEQIIAMGFDEKIVKRAARLVDLSEYKRRQSPPCVKITPRAFGKDRRLPITNQFREYP